MSDNKSDTPLLPLGTTVVFPGCVGTVQFRRARSLRLVEQLKKGRDEVVLLPLLRVEAEDPHESDLSAVGVLARPIAIQSTDDQGYSVTFEGVERVRVDRLTNDEPYLTGAYVALAAEAESDALRETAKRVYTYAGRVLESDSHYSAELVQILAANRGDISRLVDVLAHHINFTFEARRDLLCAPTLKERILLLQALLHDECQRLDLEQELKVKVEETMGREQREVYLRAKLKEIKKELGEEGEYDNLAGSYRNRAQMLNDLPIQVKEQIFLETERLRVISTASSEYGLIKSYLDWLLAIPWQRLQEQECDLAAAQKLIDSHFYGAQSVKDRIMEYLAIRQLSDNVTSSALCLCGPAGTGKAALASAISDALGRKLIRFSVAGLVDPIEVRGEPRILVGAMPGNIVTSLIEAGYADPVVLIEDLDKLCRDETRLSAALAFLGVIDHRQNGKYIDDYVGLPLDLSRAIFIFSVRSADDIPEALVERMEVVEFAGYIDREKLLIAQKYLIPSLQRSYGLEADELTFSQGAIRKLVQNYTIEAGLGQLKGRVETIFRRYTRHKATSKRAAKWSITEDNLEKHLGTPVYIPEKATSHPEVGVAAGVAWTGAGGDIMMIEGLKMRGAGSVTCTGSLGDIMRESVQAAHSFVRSKADLLSIPHEDFATYDIHVHFPQGAIPKDGPSAGATISLVIASVLSDRAIRNDMAMTGEVSLRGKVLPVSGVKEKVAAAHRAGIYKFVLPSQNRKDLKEITRELREEMEFIFIDRTEELFEIALLDYQPGAETLEDLLVMEMKKQQASKKNGKTRAAKSRTVTKPKKKKPVRRRTK